MIRNMILDWSGTLVDDLPAVWEATNYVFAQAGMPEISLDVFRAEFSLPFTGMYDRFTPHVPLPQLEAWFHGRFKEVQASVLELPHAREFLEFCRERRLRVFLLSAIHKDHFTAQTASTGFDAYLEKPYVGVWDKRAKIHEILLENDLNPGETLFVGDMQHDIETAKHGGVHSCAVLTGYNRLDQLLASEPDIIVEHLGELRGLLAQHGLHWPPPQGAARDPYPIVTVGALLFDGRGSVLMVRTHKWSNLWGIPGGKTRYGETSVAALRREVAEETGLEITDIKFVMVQDCVESPEFYRKAHFVLMNYTARCLDPAAVRLNREAQEFRWVSPQAALELALNTPTRTLVEAVLAYG